MAELNSIEQTAQLYAAMTNRPMGVSSSFNDVVKALQGNEPTVVVEIPWKERRDGDYHERHQVIVSRVAEGRVYFVNALKTVKPVGEVIGGVDRGPLRRVEPNGEESIEMPMFLTLFLAGGKALIPG